jgi:hypothetical protein
MTNYTVTDLQSFAMILKDGTMGLFFDFLLIPLFIIVLIVARDLDNFNAFIVGCFINTILCILLLLLNLVSSVSLGIWIGLLVFGLLAKFLIR